MDIKAKEIEIIDSFRSLAEKEREAFFRFFKSFLESQRTELKRKLSGSSVDMTETARPAFKWKQLEEYFNFSAEGLEVLNQELNNLLESQVVPDWHETLRLNIADLPESIIQSIDLIKCTPLTGDSYSMRIRKNYSRRLYLLKIKLYRFFKKTDNYLDNARKINLPNYLNYYVGVNCASYLNNSWNRQLQFASESINKFQEITEQLKDQTIECDHLSQKEQYWQKAISSDPSGYINQTDISLKHLLNSLNEYFEKESGELNIFLDRLIRQLDINREISGSTILPNAKYNGRKIRSAWHTLKKNREKAIVLWRRHIFGIADDCFKDNELAKIQLKIAQLWHETRQIVKNKFYADIVPHFSHITTEIKKALSAIDDIQTGQADISKIKNIMLLQNRNLMRLLRDEELPQLLELMDPQAFAQTFSGFIKRVESDIEKISDERTILTYLDSKRIPPRSKSDQIAIKEILQHEIVESIIEMIDKTNYGLQIELDAASRTIASLDQVIDYNLEGAMQLIREQESFDNHEEAVKIFREGLSRAEQSTEELQSKLRTYVDEKLNSFDLIAAEMQQDVQKLGNNEKILELKIRLTRAKTAAKYDRLRQTVWELIKTFVPKIIKILSDTFKNIAERYSRVQRLAGFSTGDLASDVSLTQYLTDVEHDIKSMPFIYQRLFKTEPLTDNKFFIGRLDTVKILQDNFDDFTNNYQPITAITGEKGSGKTSLINFARNNIFKNYSVVDIDISYSVSTETGLLEYLKDAFEINECNSLSEFTDRLVQHENKRICIVENIQNLFLRTIEGFEAIENFLLLISKTRHKIFWIVSCGKYAWEYLDSVVKISSFFRQIISVDNLDDENLMKLILERHQISGFGLNFMAPEKTLRSRQFRKLASKIPQQQYLRDQFFRDLTEAAEGNIRVAIYLWLCSIKNFKESELDIAPEITLDHASVHQLSSEEFLTLAGFIQHEYLNEQQHATIFNLAPGDSSSIIERLFKKGLLLKSEFGFYIHPYLFRPVVKALKLRNML